MAQNKFLREDATFAALTTSDLPALTIPSSTQTDFISGIVKAPLNQNYRIVEKMPYAATLTTFAGKTSTGTLTAVLKVNTTTVTGGTLGVTSTQTSSNPSGANTAASGDVLVITASATTSPGDFSFTVAFTRTLA